MPVILKRIPNLKAIFQIWEDLLGARSVSSESIHPFSLNSLQDSSLLNFVNAVFAVGFILGK